MFLFIAKYFVKGGVLNRKATFTVVDFFPDFSPKKKDNPNFKQYMISTLLAHKPFLNRSEILDLDDEQLLITFKAFLDSDICPHFIVEQYDKANAKKDNKEKKTDGDDDVEKEEETENNNKDAEEEDFIFEDMLEDGETAKTDVDENNNQNEQRKFAHFAEPS